ncbi:acetyl-coenzyme a synthetase 2 [Anaeramoeba ignava]|uniref:Acetyl-coenzyme a synthetase 2 n=1 Tax=Anaeramoeba ignava TaxID=1746090 RepID=A0A9Q0LQX2_ANAIG|nr:acetyl-coenzyme a synthetase 2 [Anaeramoeba ignava]
MDTLEVIAPKELPNAYLKTFDEYKDLYLKSVQDPITFWKEQAEEFLTWDSPFESVLNGELTKGNVKYFEGGKLNVCYNCVDRHLPKKADQIALIYEGDDPKDTKNVTYSELKDKVRKSSLFFSFFPCF